MALIGQGGRIEQTTGAFWASCTDAEELCRGSPEIEGVLNGIAAEATVSFGELTATVLAAIGADGERRAVLTIPPGTEVVPAGPDNALLAESLDDSPAIVWLKGLDGRYLQVNHRFTSLLGTSAERVCGSTDAELEPQETVDGPRLLERDESLPEPLQLEYTVPAFKGRPTLAVLRFPVRARDGDPVAICGVAAPFGDAEVARAEASRLHQIERWSWADPEAIRAELLAVWQVTIGLGEDPGDLGPAPGADGPVEAAGAGRGQALGAAITERDAALATNDWLQRQLDEERTQAAAHGEASATAITQVQELTSALEAAHVRHQELEGHLAEAAQRASVDVGLNEQLEQHRQDAQEARDASEAALSRIQLLEDELEVGRGQAAALQDAVQAATQQAQGLAGTLEAERSRRDELEGALAQEQRRATDLDGSRGEELEEQRRRVEQARADAEAVSTELVDLRRRVEQAQVQAATVSAERDAALATIEDLGGAVAEAKSRAAELGDAVLAADRRAQELTGTLESERDGREELERAIAQAQELLEATELSRAAEIVEQRQLVEQTHTAAEAMSTALAEHRQRAEQALAQAGAVSAERDAALATIENLGRELEEATRGAAELDEAVRRAHEQAHGLTDTLEAERSRREDLEGALAQEQRRATDLDGSRSEELVEQRQRAQDAHVRAEAVSAERDAALATIENLGRELEEATREAVELGDAVRAADRHARELTGTVESERDGREELELAIAQAQKRLEATDLKREAELVAQRQQVEQVRAEAGAVSAERDEQRQRAEQARAQATAISGERDAALATIENLGRELEQTTGRAAELGEAVRAAEERTDELTVTLQSARDGREELERAIAQAQERLGDSDAAREAELVEQRQQAEQARVQSEVISAERDAALAAIEDLGRELAQARGRAAELGDAVLAAQERTDELTATLETERDSREALERAIAQGEERVAQGEERVAQAEERVAQAAVGHEAELVEQRRRAEQEQADTEIATAAHDSALEAVERLKRELDEERGQRSALSETSETSARRVDELSQVLADAQARVADLERGLADASSQVAELDARPSNEELAAERGRAEAATADAEQARASADAAGAELEAALAALGALETEVEEKRRHLATVDETSATSASHAQELLELIASERIRVVDLEAALAQAHDTIKRLADRPPLEELHAQRDRAARAEAEMHGVRAQADSARREIEMADARVAAARADALALKADADALRQALARPSEEQEETSWRASEPLASPAPTHVTQPAKPPATPPAKPPATPPDEEEAVEAEEPSSRRPSWSEGSDLVISASLASATDWRTGMKAAVKSIGSEGEWDAVTAWLSEDQDALTCAAMWTVDATLAVFETLTWQTRPSVSGSRLGQALLAARPTWVTDIDQEQDNRLSRAAGNGMRSALLVPVRDGSSDLGVLELLTRARIEPDGEIAIALEEASRQLALLASAWPTTGWKPWRL